MQTFCIFALIICFDSFVVVVDIALGNLIHSDRDFFLWFLPGLWCVLLLSLGYFDLDFIYRVR